MATLEATGEGGPAANRSGRWSALRDWWLAGTPFDWGFAALGAALIGAGYYQAWLTRQTFPNVPSWSAVPVQVAWLALALYVGVASVVAWRREGNAQTAVPEGYGLSVVGLFTFLAGIVINGWWSAAFGTDFGVPAIFRLPNLLEIAGAVLIVVGPMRASAARGELVLGPTALASAVLLLAAVTFFTQFDHPYIDRYATTEVKLPPPTSDFDQYNHREEILGALGLLMQTATVVGVILWTLRQNRLPPGSLTLTMTVAAFLTATQRGHFDMVAVGLIVGALADLALVVIGLRGDRVVRVPLFAVALGGLIAGVYLLWIGVSPGTWWPPDMTYGTVLACAIVGGLISYVLFPGADAARAASVLWPALSQESSAEAPDVTVDRVEHALKVLHSTRDLADNPLVGMRCVATRTPGQLRKTIEAAIEHLRSSPFQQDAQAGQILDLYYVRRIGVHYAVQIRVGLSKAAYFNRRSYGVRRLVDRLRELEESAASA